MDQDISSQVVAEPHQPPVVCDEGGEDDRGLELDGDDDSPLEEAGYGYGV